MGYWQVGSIPLPNQAECIVDVPVGARILAVCGSVRRPDLLSLYFLREEDNPDTEQRKFVQLTPGRFTEMDGANAKLINQYEDPNGRPCFVFEEKLLKPTKAKAA